MIWSVKPSAKLKGEVGGAGGGSRRAANLLNLIIVTLTVPAAAKDAIERGSQQLLDWMRLLETGTDEQVAAEEARRGAVIKADIEVWRLTHPAIEPGVYQLAVASVRRDSAAENQISRNVAETGTQAGGVF